ncbi:MAG: DUF4397 domain-containing protein [Gemmatimonadaceae bacterium]
MRLLRVIPLAALFLVGACDEDGVVRNSSLPPLAFIRYVNAVPDAGALDFKFIDAIEFSPSYANSPFRTVGIYQGARAGSRSVKVFRNSSDITVTQQVITTATLNLVAGTYYTILHSGYVTAANGPVQSLVLLNDTRPAQNTGLHVGAVNTAMGLPAQDFFATATTTTTLVGATPIFTGLVGGARSATYAARATGAFAVQAAATTTTTSTAAAGAAAGFAGTTLVDPVGGHSVAGTQFSAFLFPASIPGSGAPTFASPGITLVVDRQPARTVPD